jgi:hypothetical protein
LRAAARLIVPCDHPRILTAPRYTIFLRDDAVSNRIHPINAPPGRCGCRRDDRHRGSKPSRGRSQGSRPFREYQPSTDGGWFPHYSGSSHGRSSPMDTRKCSTAVIAAKTPVTLWQEMASGFAPAPVLTPVTGYRSSPARALSEQTAHSRDWDPVCEYPSRPAVICAASKAEHVTAPDQLAKRSTTLLPNVGVRI